MYINYAAWAVPIGWIVPTLDHSIVTTATACPTTAIDGFLPPTNTFYSSVTLLNTAVVINLSASAQPSANTFTYSIVPMAGPYGGTVTLVGALATYTPASGASQWDGFFYTMTDAQGRSITRSVVINVGSAAGVADRKFTALTPFIDFTKIKTDRTGQAVSFPIYMPHNVRSCEVFRLTLKQPATDCDNNIFDHFMCFDIRSKDC
jgi:hypothetical protein